MSSLVDTVLCLFNSSPAELDDRAYDCSEFAAWHIAYENDTHTQCCDAHLGRATEWRPVKTMHEFMSACNLPGSWYCSDANGCVTEERGIELGILTYEDELKEEANA